MREIQLTLTNEEVNLLIASGMAMTGLFSKDMQERKASGETVDPDMLTNAIGLLGVVLKLRQAKQQHTQAEIANLEAMFAKSDNPTDSQ
jgi:hypothetical protein